MRYSKTFLKFKKTSLKNNKFIGFFHELLIYNNLELSENFNYF